jgi:hypothetical protein
MWHSKYLERRLWPTETRLAHRTATPPGNKTTL